MKLHHMTRQEVTFFDKNGDEIETQQLHYATNLAATLYCDITVKNSNVIGSYILSDCVIVYTVIVNTRSK